SKNLSCLVPTPTIFDRTPIDLLGHGIQHLSHNSKNLSCLVPTPTIFDRTPIDLLGHGIQHLSHNSKNLSCLVPTTATLTPCPYATVDIPNVGGRSHKIKYPLSY
ncbi:hypothetical protein, partial [Microseira wollei]|uniref:hypothetical protein n=1 Tax=Microseira wollei TaxID=467598 RepID=UPI001CFCD8D1